VANLFQQLESKLKNSAEKKRIDLPESSDERILCAASRLEKSGIIEPILIGNEAKVTERFQQLGMDGDAIKVIDPHEYSDFQAMADANISVDFINISPEKVVYTVPDHLTERTATILEQLGYEYDTRQKAEELFKENEEHAVLNPTISLESETFIRDGDRLNEIIEDASFNFILGEIDEDGFNAEMEKWKEQGGNNIIEEFNASK